jgi:hypothetical protein
MNIRSSLIRLTALAFYTVPATVLAVNAPRPDIPGNPISLSDIVDIIRRVVNIGISLATLAIIVMVIYGGFKMATAGSESGDFTKGKDILYNAMWGALVVFGVGLIVNTTDYSLVI